MAMTAIPRSLEFRIKGSIGGSIGKSQIRPDISTIDPARKYLELIRK
jgi:hypothetical protein